jgi:hypothetical protein
MGERPVNIFVVIALFAFSFVMAFDTKNIFAVVFFYPDNAITDNRRLLAVWFWILRFCP